MGFDEGEIILNSDIYYAGQTLHGKLEFNLDNVINFRGLYLEMKGFCKVHWTTSHTRQVNDNTERYNKTYESYEEYVKIIVYLVGSKSGEHHLQPGPHMFPFEFTIPASCPSSFEGSNGHVRYHVKAVVDKSFRFDQQKAKKFKVISPLDLNANPYCKEPMIFELSNSYCCWCVSAGSSNTVIKLPVSGYCLGQVIPLEVTCLNNSNVEIDLIKFAIKRVITFYAECEPATRYDHDTIAELKKGPILGHSTKNWNVQFEVPAMDVNNLNGCQYIDINYKLKVSIEVGGCHEGSEESRPIIFGDIPLVGFQDIIQNRLPENTQGVNSYPPPPIVNQPLLSYNSGGNAVTPTDQSSYPLKNPPYPLSHPVAFPVPDATAPYPTFESKAPYPTSEAKFAPYPTSEAKYAPYPTSETKYAPYPTSETKNAPYPTSETKNAPYPTSETKNVPYPTSETKNVPYPTSEVKNTLNPDLLYTTNLMTRTTGKTVLKTGTIGFAVPGSAVEASMPLLAFGPGIPYLTSPANPYAKASAPSSLPNEETE